MHQYSGETTPSTPRICWSSRKQSEPVACTSSSNPSDCNRPPASRTSAEQARSHIEASGYSSVLSSPSCYELSPCSSASDDHDSVALSVMDGSCLDFSSPSGERGSQDAPQFIMPRVLIPSPESFTDEGKSLGKLKLLIAGNTGESI